MLLWVTVMVTIVGIGVLVRKGDDMDDIWCYSILITTILAGLVAFTCLVLFIGAHSQYFKTQARNGLDQKRYSILYVMEKNNGSIVGLAGDIAEYNSTVLNGRMTMHNIWLKNLSYDFYDELELIEVSVDG